MSKLASIRPLVVLVVVVVGIYCALRGVRRYLDPFRTMKAGVIQTTTPLSLAAAQPQCPVPLPESASNIQYAVWSLWRASQTFVKFEAPATECLEHAGTVLQHFAQKQGAPITSTNVQGPQPTPAVFSPKDLNIPWFDLSRFSAGTVFTVSGAGTPTVWVDTNRGCFYYTAND